MKIAYYPDTDSMYIDLKANSSVESKEVSPGVVLDYDDAGNLMRSVRRTRVLNENMKRLFFSRLEVDIESGVGIPNDTNYEDPHIVLRFSDDGGRTWSNELWQNMGKLGDYTHRAVWNKLGSSVNRIFEVTISDPVKRVMIDAHADVMVGLI